MGTNAFITDSKALTTDPAHPSASQSTFQVHDGYYDGESDDSFARAEETNLPRQWGWISAQREWWMVGCFAIMATLVTLDGSILIPILPELASKYHQHSSEASKWPILVYILAHATLQRCHVALMGIFGRRNMLLIGLSIFTLGLVILSTCPLIFPILLVGRGLQGGGAAALVSVPTAIMMDMVPRERRSIYNFIIKLGALLGVILGLDLAGFLIDQSSWKWIFYISAPFCALLITITPFAVQPVGESLEPKKKLMNVDWTGMLLYCASMTALLLGLMWASSLQKHVKWEVLVPLATGTAGVIITMIYERSGASRPAVPSIVLKVCPLTFICVFIQSVLIAVQLLWTSAYLRTVHDLTSRQAGICLISMAVPLVFINAALNTIPTRFYNYRWPFCFGWAMVIASSASLTVFNTVTSLRKCVVVMIVTGLAHGITIFGTHAALRVFSAPNTQVERDAYLVANFIRTSGFSLAIAGAESAFHTRMAVHKARNSSAEAYAMSFRDLMYALTAIAGLGGLFCLSVALVPKKGLYMRR